MKKMRVALFAVICLIGTTACGESPMAPSANVPLMGAEAGSSEGSTTNTTTTTNTTEENTTTTTNKKGPRRTLNSGYILGMD